MLISSNIVDLIAQILNWTELDDDFTEFNNEMPLTEKGRLILSFYISDTLFSYFDIVQLLWHFCIIKSAI